MLYTGYIPFMLFRVKSRVFDFAVKPVAAAEVGSSSPPTPMDAFPSATSLRKSIAAL